MCLETIKNLLAIGDVVIERVEWDQPSTNFIEINNKDNAITFKFQNGPIKEFGVNGCQIDDVVKIVNLIIMGLNKNFPCRENALVITKLDEAIHWLDHRTKDRIDRNVEGNNIA